jgi:methylmalonyl-CoA mutase N-terminal domain/subunit
VEHQIRLILWQVVIFVESLTTEVENKAWDLMNKITAMGGSVSAIEQGFMQEEIARSAFEYQRNIESGDKIIVGVNKFTIDKENPVPGFKIDDSIRQLQTVKLAELKSKRDQVKVDQCLSAIKAAATGTNNLMPLLVEAVETYCTLGEIADTLRQVYGEHR